MKSYLTSKENFIPDNTLCPTCMFRTELLGAWGCGYIMVLHINSLKRWNIINHLVNTYVTILLMWQIILRSMIIMIVITNINNIRLEMILCK